MVDILITVTNWSFLSPKAEKYILKTTENQSKNYVADKRKKNKADMGEKIVQYSKEMKERYKKKNKIIIL